MLGGRRAAIRNLGLFAGGMAALLGAREVDAKERKRTKKRRQGKAGAEASPENPGVPPHACCTPCPATGSECLIAVRDASTGKCEKIPKRSGLPCGSSGTCGSDGTCYECNDTRAQPPETPLEKPSCAPTSTMRAISAAHATPDATLITKRTAASGRAAFS